MASPEPDRIAELHGLTEPASSPSSKAVIAIDATLDAIGLSKITDDAVLADAVMAEAAQPNYRRAASEDSGQEPMSKKARLRSPDGILPGDFKLHNSDTTSNHSDKPTKPLKGGNLPELDQQAPNPSGTVSLSDAGNPSMPNHRASQPGKSNVSPKDATGHDAGSSDSEKLPLNEEKEAEALEKTLSETDIEEKIIDTRDAPYCSQECLHAVVHGGDLDTKCPNYRLHIKEQRPSASEIRQLVRMHCCTTFGNENIFADLKRSGSTGSLIKVRLPSHGYTFVAKGVAKQDADILHHEDAIYRHVASLQGSIIPVNLGLVELTADQLTAFVPFIYDMGIRSLLLLSFCGLSLESSKNRPYRDLFTSLGLHALGELHDKGVLHKSPYPDNTVFDPETRKLMIVDLERSRFSDDKDAFTEERAALARRIDRLVNPKPSLTIAPS